MYVLYNPAWPGHAKVGKALDLKDRVKVYQTGSPFRDYRLIASAFFADRKEAERDLQRLLEGHRVGRTEWFFIHPEDAAAMLRRISKWRKHERTRPHPVGRRSARQVRHRTARNKRA